MRQAIALVMCLAAACTSPKAPPARQRTPAEKAAITAAIDEMKAKAEKEDLVFFDAVVAAHATVRLDPVAACPSSKEQLTAGASSAFVATTRLKLDKRDAFRGPAEQAVGDATMMVSVRLDDDYLGEDQLLAEVQRRHAQLKPRRLELVFLIEEELEPQLIEGTKFTPGRVAGLLYVWDRDKGAIACGARTAATNDEAVTVYGTDLGMASKPPSDTIKSVDLKINLLENAIDHGLANLKAVAPAS